MAPPGGLRARTSAGSGAAARNARGLSSSPRSLSPRTSSVVVSSPRSSLATGARLVRTHFQQQSYSTTTSAGVATLVQEKEEEEQQISKEQLPEPAVSRAPLKLKQGVVIVGGGPAGLASALTLAQRGWTDITIVEKRRDVLSEDMDRAYVYRVDARGEALLSHIQMPNEMIDRHAKPTQQLDITLYQPDGSTQERSLPLGGNAPGRWMPRASLVRMLMEDGLKLGAARGWASNIKMLTGHSLKAMEREPRADGGWEVKVTVADEETGACQEFYPQLVIGSDGVNSVVRTTLMAWEQQDASPLGQEEEEQALPTPFAARFGLEQLDSPSAGLQYKVLRLPPRPKLTRRASCGPLDSNRMAVVVGKDKALDRRIRLGFMPVQNQDAPRTCNIIMPASGHDLLKVKDAEGLYRYLEAQVPQLPVRELIPVEEATRFAQARPGHFPKPQHVNGLQFSARAPGADIQGYGVVLVGDARAAFPPDAGQGVNSALEDVVSLAKALDEAGDNIPAALERYEAARLPDIKALAQLMTFAAPYQYQQSPWRVLLWGLDLQLRHALSRLAPALFHPHIMRMVSDPAFSYARALELHQTTTRRLQAAGAALGALALAAAAKAFLL